MINVVVTRDHMLEIIVDGTRMVSSKKADYIDVIDHRCFAMEDGLKVPLSVVQWVLRENKEVLRARGLQAGDTADFEVRFTLSKEMIDDIPV